MSEIPLTVLLEKLAYELARAPSSGDEEWRADTVTEKQIELLAKLYRERLLDERLIPPPNLLTRGKASDLIGCFLIPEPQDIAPLRHFKVRGAANMTQTEARRALREIFADPKKKLAWENRPNIKIVAPSGFEFPFFENDRLVHVFDRTDYLGNFLSLYDDAELDSYGETEFSKDLSCADLEIEVESFGRFIASASLQKIGYNLFSGFHELHSFMTARLLDERDPVIIINTPLLQRALDHGMVASFEIAKNPAQIASYLEGKTKADLEAECGRLGLMKAGKKADLITRLTSVTEHLKIEPHAKLTANYFSTVDKLWAIYITDLDRQLHDKPSVYGVVVWDAVLESNDQIPDFAKSLINKKRETKKK